jgi:hypothetical protein
MAREGAGRNDSVIVLTQPNWYGVSLAALSANKNGFDGEQTAYISLTEFYELPNPQEGIEGNRSLTWGEGVSSIRARSGILIILELILSAYVFVNNG